MSNQEPLGEVPASFSAQGVQIGSGNNQYNAWMPKHLDPASITGLNPHTALVRLQQFTHDDLVDFFARVPSDDVTEILEVFLEADVSRVVGALGDISRRKAEELISIVSEGTGDPLNELPEAAQAIAREAARLRWAGAGPLQFFSKAYTRKYEYGHVHWSNESGTRTTTGVIDDYYAANDRECVGATGDQESESFSPFGTGGIRQKFVYGTIYASEHGVFRVTADKFYDDEMGSIGWLGFPIEESKATRGLGRLQWFEGGVISSYYKERQHHAITVRNEIAGVLPDQRWRALSEEVTITSTTGAKGTVQGFEVAGKSGIYATNVYLADEGRGPVAVSAAIWNYYSSLGAAESWLGFPLAREQILSDRARFQKFEMGVIYWQHEGVPIAVPTAVLDLVAQSYESPGKLGFPISETRRIYGGESDLIQFFELGVVTLRDGKGEIWIRPLEEVPKRGRSPEPKDGPPPEEP